MNVPHTECTTLANSASWIVLIDSAISGVSLRPAVELFSIPLCGITVGM